MRTRSMFPLIVVLITVLSGCSAEKTNAVPITPSAESMLKQAQDQLPFKVTLPTLLPSDMKLSNVLVSNNPNTGKPNSINLQFTSKKLSLDVIEQEANGLGHIGFGQDSSEKDITVNNSKARFSKNDKFTSMLWLVGEKTIFISVQAKSEISSEEELLKIAESFK